VANYILLSISVVIGYTFRLLLPLPATQISLLDLSVLAFLISSLIYHPQKILSSLKYQYRLVLPILIFFLIDLISLNSSAHLGRPALLVGALYLFRWLVYSLAFSFIFNPRLALLLIGSLTTATSLIQYLFWPDVRFLSAFQWDPHYYRVVGSFLDPGFTGLILVFTLIYLTIRPLKNLRFNRIFWVLAYIALALTYSRSSYLAFLTTFAFIAYTKRSWVYLFKKLLLFAVTLLLLPRPGGEGVRLSRTNSVYARIYSWQQAVDIFSRQPLFGVGFNTYRYVQKSDFVSHAGAGADSSLLFAAATTGIVGFSIYYWYLSRLAKTSRLLAVSVTAAITHSFFLNSLFYPLVILWLSLLLKPKDYKSP